MQAGLAPLNQFSPESYEGQIGLHGYSYLRSALFASLGERFHWISSPRALARGYQNAKESGNPGALRIPLWRGDKGVCKKPV